MRIAWLFPLCLALSSGASDTEAVLDPPVRLEALGKPIDVFGGHAAPSVGDLDGDGVRDLLVGQFLGEGEIATQAAMRVYRNIGTEGSPRLAASRYLDGGGGRAWVPTG